MFPPELGLSSGEIFHFFSDQRGVFLMQLNLNFLKTIGFTNTNNGIYTCLLGTAVAQWEGAVLQIGRSLVRSQLPIALWPWGRLSL